MMWGGGCDFSEITSDKFENTGSPKPITHTLPIDPEILGPTTSPIQNTPKIDHLNVATKRPRGDWRTAGTELAKVLADINQTARDFNIWKVQLIPNLPRYYDNVYMTKDMVLAMSIFEARDICCNEKGCGSG